MTVTTFTWKDLYMSSIEKTVEVVNELYKGEPVDRQKIAKRLKLTPDQVTQRLHAAQKAGLVKNIGGRIASAWVPTGVACQRLRTRKEQVAEIVEELYDGTNPVQSWQVAKRFPGKSPRTIGWCLDEARVAGLIKSFAGGKGWLPANVKKKPPTLLEQTAQAVNDLYHGRPVGRADVARHLGVSPDIVSNRLARAKNKGLIERHRSSTGYVPLKSRRRCRRKRKAKGA